MRILARPVRRPLATGSALDDVRREVLTRVNAEIVWRARATPRLWLVCADHAEDLDLDRSNGDPLATFQAVSSRTDVLHRLLCGTAAGPDGRSIGFVFGASRHGDGGWWLASRPFTRLPGGLGSSERTWEVVTGAAGAPWPNVMDALRGSGAPCDLLPARALPWPEIGCRVDDLANGAAPVDPLGATQILAEQGIEIESWRRGLDSVLIAVFRRGTLERWMVDGEIPCAMDDLVRAICAIGPPPAAVATVRIELFDDRGTYRRAVRTVAEVQRQRVERLLVLDFETLDQATPDLRLFGTHPARVGPDGWIGVRPGVKVEQMPQVAEA